MNLSLREARKLETRIQAIINKGIVPTRQINAYESVLGTEIGTDHWLAETFELGNSSVRSVVGLINARSTIRRKVQACNETVGINLLISQRKEYMAERSVWLNVMSQYDSESGRSMTTSVLQQIASAAVEISKTTSSSRYGTRTDTVSVSTISNELYTNAKAEARKLLRTIDSIEDKLAGLNAATKIELDSTLVEFLETQELM